jgi:hypothetical protein
MRRYLLAATALTSALLFLVPGAIAQAPAPSDWSGFYLGFGLGGSAGQATTSFDYTDAVSSPDSVRVPMLGADGTITGGFNVQNGNFVYGIAADGSLLTVHGKATGPGYDVQAQLDSLFALRGRLGITAGQMLFFATAGVAGGHVDFSSDVVDTAGTPPFTTAVGDGFAVGTTYGAGVEVTLNDKISLTTEGIVTNLGPVTGIGDNGKGSYTASTSTTNLTVRSGLNFHFLCKRPLGAPARRS